MKVEKKDDKVVVVLEDETVRYGSNRMFKDNYLTSEGAIKLESWKIDLIENHGVDLDELRS